jgi:RHS repeat-associated protein
MFIGLYTSSQKKNVIMKQNMITFPEGMTTSGARYYDSYIGRWLSVDPLADKYPGWSPYNYTMNSPLKYVNPDGKESSEIEDDEDNVNDSEKKKRWFSICNFQ